MPQSSVRAAVEAFARGEIVVVTDDDDRENEGDLIIAAAHATPEKMAFIIRHTCGIVCAPVTAEIARRLHLAPMVADSDAIHGTAFTISVDYRHGTTTGISAEERTATIRALANGNTGRADFVRPGHIFPLIAKDGGVLIRSGHTEAAIDLCRLAGIEPVAAICELVNDDGTVMRGPQVAAFAKKNALRRIAVADLIAYRQAREKLVTRVAEFTIDTEAGEFAGYAYVTPFDKVHHFAFVYGDISDGRNVPTRLHRANVIEDVFAGAKPIHTALARFKEAGRGVLVYLREGTSGVPTTALADDSTPSELERSRHWKDIGLGAQILRDLDIRSIRLLATRARTYVGLAGFGIEIAATEPLEEPSNLRLIVKEADAQRRGGGDC
ncbi:MAG: 3,4-dihydroxy-2-butanone-4-phosphate synthase [Thiohalocapsa sp.]